MSGSVCLNWVIPVVWRALHGSILIGEAMKTRLLALVLTIMSGAVSLAGCGGSTRSEPSLEDVSGRFAAMKTYDLTGDGGKVTISAKKQGTVYLLAMRPDLRKVDAGRCTVDGKTMRSSSSTSITPQDRGRISLSLPSPRSSAAIISSPAPRTRGQGCWPCSNLLPDGCDVSGDMARQP